MRASGYADKAGVAAGWSIQPLGRPPLQRVTVTLATDLVDEDPRFQDYVIVHELLHLRVRNHGRLFKVLMTAYVPGWRQISQRHAESASARSGMRNIRRARRSPQDAGTTSRDSLRSGFNRRR